MKKDCFLPRKRVESSLLLWYNTMHCFVCFKFYYTGLTLFSPISLRCFICFLRELAKKLGSRYRLPKELILLCNDLVYDKCPQCKRNYHHHIKIPMFCFVTEKFHAQKSSCKAAKQAQTKERFLRYPPFVCSCLVLICTKKYERQKAHCGKIYYNVFQHIFVLI